MPVRSLGTATEMGYWAMDHGANLSAEVGSLTSTLRTLCGIWGRTLPFPRMLVGPDEDFFGLGGDSMGAVYLESQIEATFNIELPVSAVIEAPTPREMESLIQECQTLSRDRTHGGPDEVFLRVQGVDEKSPVFLWGGGIGDSLHSMVWLARIVDRTRPFYAANSRAEQDVEDYATWVPVQARMQAEAILAINPEGPYRLIANCSGGALAWETALQLEARGKRDVRVFLVDPLKDPSNLLGEHEVIRTRATALYTPSAPLQGQATIVVTPFPHEISDGRYYEAQAAGPVTLTILPSSVTTHALQAETMPYIAPLVHAWIRA